MRNIEIRTLNQLNYELVQKLRNFIVLNQQLIKILSNIKFDIKLII